MKTVEQLRAEWLEYTVKVVQNRPDESLRFEKDGCLAVYYPHENVFSVGTEGNSVTPEAARALALWLVSVTEGLE